MRPKNDQKMTILTILKTYDNNDEVSMMLMCVVDVKNAVQRHKNGQK